jgi:streptogramin lyase
MSKLHLSFIDSLLQWKSSADITGVVRMSIHMHARAARFFLPSMALLCLLLAGCGFSQGAPGHTFQGKLSLLQVPAPYSLPGQIVLGPDGNLWFPAVAYGNFTTDKPSGAIGQLTTSGKFRLFPMPKANSYPLAIAFGRDGKLWFSAFQGNGQLAPNVDQAPRFSGGYSEFGQMSQDGRFHLFTLPSSTISPRSIAVGADGNLWFTDTGAGSNDAWVNKIGRLTPSGAFSEFPLTLRKATDFINLLIAGPDGNLWFSIDSELPDYSVFGEMGRITPQGTVTIFTLGKFVEPRDMTVGPDNNIWFSSGGLIGRITMKGQLHLSNPDPQNRSNYMSSSGITSGSDGALWFATVNVAVGRVTTSGTFKFYPFPPNINFDNGGSSLDIGNLRGIVTGTDGTLWLTNDAQIGHFV